MTKLWVETNELRRQLSAYFTDNKSDLQAFGSTVNQTFEAFVFASVVEWYRKNGWAVDFIQPANEKNFVKLKFSTRGKPDLYTYALCSKKDKKIQVRHGLRVATKSHNTENRHAANIVLDVAVISDLDLKKYESDDGVANKNLLTFGEAKHMSAFAELVASFIGLVHEMLPEKLNALRCEGRTPQKSEHPSPFLYVSGFLNPTAQGLIETIRSRGYDIDVYNHASGPDFFGLKLKVKKVVKKRKTDVESAAAEKISF